MSRLALFAVTFTPDYHIKLFIIFTISTFLKGILMHMLTKGIYQPPQLGYDWSKLPTSEIIPQTDF